MLEMRRKAHALLWGLFSAGGFAAAFLVPVHIILINLAVPLGLLEANSLDRGEMILRLSTPIVRLYLLAFIILTIFHAMFRFQPVLADLKFKRASRAFPLVGWSIIGVASALTVYAVINIPLP